MVSSDRFMQMPPNSFDRICLRRIYWQEINLNSMTQSLKVFSYVFRLVERSIAADHMDTNVTPKTTAKVDKRIFN